MTTARIVQTLICAALFLAVACDNRTPQLESEVVSLKRAMTREVSTVADLTEKNEGLTANLADSQTENADLTAKNEELTANLADSQMANANLTAKNEELAANLADSQAAVADLTAKNEGLTANITDSLTSVANLTARNEGLTSNLADSRTAVADLTAKNAELTSNLADSQTENANLTATVSDSQAAVSDLTAKNAELTTDLADSRAANADLAAKNEGLTTDLADSRAAVSDLTAKLRAAEREEETVTSIAVSVVALNLSAVDKIRAYTAPFTTVLKSGSHIDVNAAVGRARSSSEFRRWYWYVLVPGFRERFGYEPRTSRELEAAIAIWLEGIAADIDVDAMANRE